MATTFTDAFDRYRTGNASTSGMLDGVWASLFGSNREKIVEPSFGARTDKKCLFLQSNNNTNARAVLRNGAVSTIFFAFAIYVPGLPDAERILVDILNGSNARIARFSIDASGFAHIRDGANNNLATSSAPVLSAGTWKFFEFRLVMHASAGEFELRDADENVLMNESGLALSSDLITGFEFKSSFQSGGGAFDGYYIDDLSVKDASGSSNNTWYPRGGTKNILVKVIADDQNSDWDFVARKMFDNGVGQSLGAPATDRGWLTPDAAPLELGAGDYFIEGDFRWNSLPGTGEEYTLAGKWNEGANQRSWRLYHYESGGEHFLAFEISTDGTTGTVTTIHDFPFTPAKWTPYFIGVGRIGGVSRMFINGVRKGPEVADANTYFDGSAKLGVARRAESVAAFDGWLDEFRYTVGAGRHATEYTPQSAKFPRDNTDPDWNNVQLLIGFDDGNAIDESQYGRTLTAQGAATALITEDGDFGYQSIDKAGVDDTFIEARLLPAEGTLEFVTNPSDTEQVVVGSTTYTFVNTLASANDVLIGVDEEESIDNLLAAINGDAGEGTIYGTGTVPNPDALAIDLPGAIIEVEARTAGTAGNSITFTTDVTDAVISGSGTLEGGEDIPGPGIYRLQSLPPGITRIDSVTLFTKRSVEGVGSATIQPAILDSSLAASNGADTSAPSNPAWQVDQFDDNGGNAWTPANLIGASVRDNRTS